MEVGLRTARPKQREAWPHVAVILLVVAAGGCSSGDLSINDRQEQAQPAADPREVNVEEGLLAVELMRVHRVEVVPGEDRLLVVYWGGNPDCRGLAAAEAEVRPDGVVTVKVSEGDRPRDGSDPCPAFAVEKVVTVPLDRPMIIDLAGDEEHLEGATRLRVSNVSGEA